MFEELVMKTKNDLPVFMGVCESVLVRGDGVLQDFYGVGDIVLLPFFPQNLNGLFLLVGLPGAIIGTQKKVSFIAQDNKNPQNKAWVDLGTISVPAQGSARVDGYSKLYPGGVAMPVAGHEAEHHMSTRLLIPHDIIYKLIPIPCPPLFVREPGEIDIRVKIEEDEFQIGRFECWFCHTPPISEEERTAIMSRPGAVRGIVYMLECKKCHDKKTFYLSIDGKNTPPDEFKESTSLTAAGDKWVCRCNETKVPLVYLKEGLHCMFRRINPAQPRKELGFVPLYQKGAITAVLSSYQQILAESGDDEEAVQKFIADNPILWNFLAPVKIWRKPPILTRYNADFALFSGMNILYFVEIEKPHTKLVKGDGGIHSDLQSGLDQIRNWRIEVDKRREAVLVGLGLTQQQVHDIRYILIAGMASKTQAPGLEKVRNMSTDAESIFCFDELASFLHCTETSLLNL
jgi:hypothetical protein